jgi:hypothetical protein
MNYASVVTQLNNAESLNRLNKDLMQYFMQAKRVAVDPSGIQLHPSYVSTIGKSIELSRAREMNLIEQRIFLEKAENQKKISQLEAEGKLAVETARSDAMTNQAKALIDAGLSPHDVGNLLVTFVGASGLAKADKVFVGVSPGLVGLRGLDHAIPSKSHHSASQDDFNFVST